MYAVVIVVVVCVKYFINRPAYTSTNAVIKIGHWDAPCLTVL